MLVPCKLTPAVTAVNVSGSRYRCNVLVPDGDSHLAARLPHHLTRDRCSMPDRTVLCSYCPDGRPARYGDLCSAHAERKRTGKPMDAPVRPYIRDREASYWSKVDKDGPVPERKPELGPCWIWTGSINPDTGYGQFHRGKQPELAHRYGYALPTARSPMACTLITSASSGRA